MKRIDYKSLVKLILDDMKIEEVCSQINIYFDGIKVVEGQFCLFVCA